MPVQSAVPQSDPDQPDAHVQSAVPVFVAQLPFPLQAMPVQSGTAQSTPDQPLLQVHTAAPELASQRPWPLHVPKLQLEISRTYTSKRFCA